MRLRERELELCLRNTNTTGTLAATLCCFAYDALLAGNIYAASDGDLCGHREILCAELLYPLSIVITIERGRDPNPSRPTRSALS